jgi:acyl-CoA thioesterase-1
MGCPLIAEPSKYLNSLLLEMAKHWPDNRIINVACHGHSVPAGYFATPYVNTLAAYPHLLLEGLKERFPFAVVNVIVTAKGGENSEGGSQRFEGEVLCHRPDVVTLDYGLNDRGIGLEKANAAWRRMIEIALRCGIRLILLTPTHDQFAIRSGDPTSEDALAQHSAQIRGLALEYEIGLADSDAAYSRYINQGGHLFDLLSHVNHPNRKGHQIVAEEILRYFPAQ